MLVLTAIFSLSLAACNQKAEPVSQGSNSQNEEVNDETSQKDNVSELSLVEVFEKSTEAMNGLSSFSTKMDMTQEMGIAGESMEMTSFTDMEYIVDPLTLYQKMEISLDGEEQVQAMEAYLTEDGFFMYEPSQEMWLKLPEEFVDQVLQLQDQQTNPADQLSQLEQFIEDFTFEQNNTHYILTLKADGEKFNDFIKEQMVNTMPDNLPMTDELFDSFSFNDMAYEIYIDKTTFYTTEMTIKMDMDTDVEGETLNLNQEVKAVYADYNEIESITIPEEALQNAQDMSSMYSEEE